jgi:hypothetical protein
LLDSSGAFTQARGINDGENILRALDLEYAHDGAAAAGAGFPGDFVVAVAGSIFTEALKFTASTDGSLGAQAADSFHEQKFAAGFAFKVWDDADIGLDRFGCANVP